MGYYTNHTLSIVESKTTKRKDVQEYIDCHEEMEYALGKSFGEDEESCKWYSHQNDMRKLSERFPDAVFLLEGEGEEAGDIWKEYYKNGKMQRSSARLVFDEYDETKLE